MYTLFMSVSYAMACFVSRSNTAIRRLDLAYTGNQPLPCLLILYSKQVGLTIAFAMVDSRSPAMDPALQAVCRDPAAARVKVSNLCHIRGLRGRKSHLSGSARAGNPA